MDQPLSILSIQISILGHKTYANQLRKHFASSYTISLDSYWLDEDREWDGRLIRRALDGAIPGSWIGERNLDFRRFRREVGNAYLGNSLVRRKFKKSKYDILHFHTQVSSLLAYHWMSQIPSVVSGDMTSVQVADEIPDQRYKFTYWPSIQLEKKVFSVAKQIVLWSQWAADSVTGDYGIDPQKVRVIHPGVDMNAFPVVERKLNPERRARLLFVGNDFRRKGGQDLLKIFLSDKIKGAVLHLVTNENIACFHPHVHIHRGIRAYSQSWMDLYEQSDIFVMPTYREAFGLVFVEAMAASLPVVATRISAIPEIVSEGQTGFLITPGDVLNLANRLQRLIDNPEMRISMGRLGRKTAEQKFDANKNFAKLEKVFNDINESSLSFGP